MTTLTIDPQRLKTLRKARKLGRPKLAKLVGMTERQITKLETAVAGPATAMAEPAADRLAAALHIPTLVLTGELALIDEDLQQVQNSCTSGCCG
ncbi:helix-turn-helix transcriptional regulator [Thalassobius sp. Cn5-15]|jgi:transcriptional regulator with XRE-family HTH domain|uniref:helix-turn-helix domain-containing protein n=1 Tax=Thalassobius sp. Cn5-15 TaxID=2917763 RepID=UPI001EF29142|nr:helix-turn-helix transcriptional regulator [Thalassobius sp. Cn5-15]MCG7492694.1 helix-turn-helix domain-containing protein [Thalassobius sp. Cn5-15]